MVKGFTIPTVWPELDQEKVHVWRADLGVSGMILERLRGFLSEAEQARAARFRFDKHRNPYIAGRGILRALLGRYLGISPQSVQFIYGQCGKPALSDDLSALRFNISHSGSYALFAFTYAREVGIDLELIRERKCLMDIARRFFAPGEVTALQALPEEEQLDAFHRCWTRKEAYLKAKGDGLSLALDQFTVSIASNDPPCLLHAENDPEEPARWCFFNVNVPESYAGVLVVETPCQDIACWEWSEDQVLA